MNEKEAHKRYILSKILLHTIFFISIVFLILLFYPYKLYEQLNSPLKVSNKYVNSGEYLIYTTEFCKYTNSPIEVQKILINDYTYFYSPYTSNYPVGCYNKTIKERIPEFTESGAYKLKIILTFEPNFLVRKYFTTDTEEFYVTNNLIESEKLEVKTDVRNN